jgi:hypothetical protein
VIRVRTAGRFAPSETSRPYEITDAQEQTAMDVAAMRLNAPTLYSKFG